MKNYRAVVIDGHRILRGGVLVLGLIFLAALFGIYINKNTNNIVADSIPVFSAAEEENSDDKGWRKGLLTAFFTFDIYDCTSIPAEEIPLIKVVKGGYLAMKAEGKAVEVYNPENADMGQGNPEPDMPEGGQYPIKEVDSSQKKALGKSKAKILIRNDTDFSVDIEKMLNEDLDFNLKGDGPQILILHTHATECYTAEGATLYSPDKSDRSLEESKNMLAVGEKMKQIFEKGGIEVIHDKTLHDHPNFNGSYANSLKTAEMYKAKYPSLKMVLDIHRDAYVYDDGSKAKFVTEINGKNTAQLMFVVGTNAGGLEHPHWRENMKMAVKLQKHITDKYPSLMRGVNLRKERFNGHTTTGSVIIEVGSSGNTLSEALRGAEYAAEEITEFFR